MMKKVLKITLITLGSLIVLLLVAAFAGWQYAQSKFLTFESDYSEQTEFTTLKEGDFSYLDRNGNGKLDVFEDSRRSVSDRAADILSQMTLEEKIHLLKGSGLASAMGKVEPGTGIAGAVGTIVPTPRLGIPTVYLSDGPAGLRIEPKREGTDQIFYCTAFPIATLLASSWNTELTEQVGDAMGEEASAYGIDVILGPGANIHRHPLCGRNFEYYSEDPVLSGYIGAAIVNGIESNNIGTSVKHFVANNQETNRNFNDAIISERALREIYLKSFEIIVRESQPWTIMSSYNKINGEYTSESPRLLTDILRNEWAFEGLVMSDWFGGQDAVAQINAGNDLLEPGTKFQWEALKEGAEKGSLVQSNIDQSVLRILELVVKSGKLDNETYSNNPDLKAHALVTRNSAAEGMVLLKNEATLPIKSGAEVALLGVTSYDFIAGGTGSGDVNEAYTVSLEEGLTNAGFIINPEARDIYENHKAANPEAFIKPEGMQAMFQPYNPPQIEYTWEQLENIASSAAVGIITIGRNAGEGGDRVEKDDFLLTATEQYMINNATKAFHDKGKKLIVVLNIGGVIETASWKDQPDAILLAWQGGQEGGNSAADILSGVVNPSGKLPMTFPIQLNDHLSNANFPLDGKPMSMFDMLSSREDIPESERIQNTDYTDYQEGIYVGYRHFDTSGKAVSFPFGYGLSYTSFSFDSLVLSQQNDTVLVQIAITNTGSVAGKEVVQVYTSKEGSSIDRPAKELKAFAKTATLNPGQTSRLHLKIAINDLQYWSEQNNDWDLETGTYTVQAGASSRDIRQIGNIEIQ